MNSGKLNYSNMCLTAWVQQLKQLGDVKQFLTMMQRAEHDHTHKSLCQVVKSCHVVPGARPDRNIAIHDLGFKCPAMENWEKNLDSCGLKSLE